MLTSETMWQFVICATADCKGQGSYFRRSIGGCRFTVEREGRERFFCDNAYPTPPAKKEDRLDRMPLKRTFENCDRDDAINIACTVDGFCLGCVGKDSVLLEGLATRSLTMIQ